MREEPTRSLLLLDANPEERRLISAIAGRANWSVVGAADEEMALALLQGPHGREVRSVLFGTWDSEKSPQLIAALRDQRPKLPVLVLSEGDSVADAVPWRPPLRTIDRKMIVKSGAVKNGISASGLARMS